MNVLFIVNKVVLFVSYKMYKICWNVVMVCVKSLFNGSVVIVISIGWGIEIKVFEKYWIKCVDCLFLNLYLLSEILFIYVFIC